MRIDLTPQGDFQWSHSSTLPHLFWFFGAHLIISSYAPVGDTTESVVPPGSSSLLTRSDDGGLDHITLDKRFLPNPQWSDLDTQQISGRFSLANFLLAASKSGCRDPGVPFSHPTTVAESPSTMMSVNVGKLSKYFNAQKAA